MNTDDFEIFKELIYQVWEKVNEGRGFAEWKGERPDFYAKNIQRYCQTRIMPSAEYHTLNEKTIKNYILAVLQYKPEEINPEPKPLELLSRLALSIPAPNDDWYRDEKYKYLDYWKQFKASQKSSQSDGGSTKNGSDEFPPDEEKEVGLPLPTEKKTLDLESGQAIADQDLLKKERAQQGAFIRKISSLSMVKMLRVLIGVEAILLVSNLFFPGESSFAQANGIMQCLLCAFAFFKSWEPIVKSMPTESNDRKTYIANVEACIPAIKYKDEDDLLRIVSTTEMHIQELYKLFKWIWAGWVFYFVVQLFQLFFREQSNTQIVASLDLMANTISVMLFYTCYIKLQSPSTNIAKTIAFWMGFILVFTVLYHLLLLKFPTSQHTNNTFYLISGLMNGVTIAMLAGRLESKLIGAPRGYIIAIYIYAALQSLIFLNHMIARTPDELVNQNTIAIPQEWRVWIGATTEIRLWLLAIGKCILFSFTIWLYNSGTLVPYFIINKESSADLEAFHLNKHGTAAE